MELEQLNLGSQPNDGQGDPLRVGGEKINNNFQVLNTFGHIGITNANPTEIDVNTPVLVDSWSFDILTPGTYKVEVAIEWGMNATNQDAIFRFDVNGATGLELNQEPKDPTNKVFLTTFVLLELNAGTNLIEFFGRKENTGATVLSIYASRFFASVTNILT